MSLINDALKRAQEDKDRGGPPPVPMLSPVLGDEPEPQATAAPMPGNRNRLVAVLLVAVLAAAGGWSYLHFKKHTPAAAMAYSNMKPADQSTVQPAAQPTTRPAGQTTVQANVQTIAQAPALPTTLPAAQLTANATTQPAALSTALKIAASQPLAAAITRPRVRVVAPPPGGLNFESPATQPAAPAALPPALAANAPAKAPANEPDDISYLPPDLRIPLPKIADTPGPAADPNDPSAAHHSAAPAAAAAKAAPASQPAAKPERTIAAAADVAQQFHVSCIMFSDQGSTAIINGSPAKVGATIRAEGTAKTGLPEEAVVKKIDRNCVEVLFGGEKYLLRI